ncbi:methyltransferase family protein [Dictyobacter kobayashii]|uniref:Isoprenylcysteine carboxyl methyltransferase n=1 Tax=Dictyobacter kobayashii TaxID=2014872 RepID=A0A402ARZ9_9CHLR|nr:isoprenylcysteine carboxylmethyltransferase family protein [Dictyobacter kobayashii]GCE21874.1 isoprenylcysteine carboxyl methyltransferase [Dictyobacter kobayashii]
MVRNFAIQALLGGMFQVLMFPLILFLAAGTLAWPAAWIFLVLLYGFVSVTARWLSRRNPGLLEERMSMFKSGQSERDRLFVPLVVVCMVWLALMPLDAVRFHWSWVPVWLQVVGALALIGSFVFMFLAFRENGYLTPTVRIQKEREHKVISTGLYQYVRHPMYSGFLLFFVGTALLLGSVYGLLFALVLCGLFAWRAVREEHTLLVGLPGYDAYMARVHYRLIPRVW